MTSPRLQQQIRQMRDQRNVRGRHRIVAQLVRTHPCELLALAWRDGAFPFPADVKRHQQMEAVIAVTGERQWRKTRLFDLDPEFFVQLTDQRGLRPLAGLELAAGKFPQPRKRLALGPLRDQDAVVRIDQRAGDDEGELDHER